MRGYCMQMAAFHCSQCNFGVEVKLGEANLLQNVTFVTGCVVDCGEEDVYMV
jgi:hypothetical protein